MAINELVVVNATSEEVVVTDPNQSVTLVNDTQLEPIVVEVLAGARGDTGPPNSLAIGTVTKSAAGGAASATITGTAPSQTLSLVLPTGDTGPANSLAIGTVTTLLPNATPTATITGAAPSQTLNLGIPAAAEWLQGSGVPAAGTGTQGDWYINTATSDLYEKTSSTVWTLRLNIKGATGNTGPAPTLSSVIVTTGAAGSAGSGSWSGTNPYTLNLTVPRGDTGATGPAPTLNTPTITALAVGATPTVGITGTNPYTINFGIPLNANWLNGAAPPATGSGNVGDYYLVTTAGTGLGDVYKKTGASTWTLQGNIRGAAGSGNVSSGASVVGNLVSYNSTDGSLIQDAGFAASDVMRLTTNQTVAGIKTFAAGLTGTPWAAQFTGGAGGDGTAVRIGGSASYPNYVGTLFGPSTYSGIGMVMTDNGLQLTNIGGEFRIQTGGAGVRKDVAYTAKSDATKEFTVAQDSDMWSVPPGTTFTVSGITYTVRSAKNTAIRVVEDISAAPATGTLTQVLYAPIRMTISTAGGVTFTNAVTASQFNTDTSAGYYASLGNNAISFSRASANYIQTSSVGGYIRILGTTTTPGDTTIAQFNPGATALTGTLTVSGGTALNGQASVDGGSNVLALKPGTADNVYLSFYARTASPGTRSAWYGYGSVASTTLQMTNEISGGAITLLTTGNGNININAGTGVVNAIGSQLQEGGQRVYSPSNIPSVSVFTTGTLADARLSTNVALLNSSPTFTGTVTAAAFAGSGASLTGINAANVTTGILPTSVLPALAITETYVVATQAAMLALSAQRGDVAIRSDLNKSFILATDSPGTLADWKELLTPTDSVLSVAGKTGAVTLTNADVGLSLINNVAQVEIAGSQTITGAKTFTIAPLINLGTNIFRFNSGPSSNTPSISLGKDTGKSVALLGGATGAAVVFDDTGAFYITKETKANIDAGTSTGGTPVLTLTAAGNMTVTGSITSGGVLTVPGTSYQTFGAAGLGAPTFTTRSAGTKIVLYDSLSGSATDAAIGMDTGVLWNSVGGTGSQFKWYGGTTLAATLTGTGNLTVAGTISNGSGGQSLNLNPGTLDHTFMAFYARTATPTTRSGYFGYPGAGSNVLTLRNDISGGDLAISTNGGSINATGSLNVSGAINAPSISARRSPDLITPSVTTNSYWYKLATYTITNIYNDLQHRVYLSSHATPGPYTAEVNIHLRTNDTLQAATTDSIQIDNLSGWIAADIRLVKSQVSNGSTPNIWDLWVKAPLYLYVSAYEMGISLSTNSSMTWNPGGSWVSGTGAGASIAPKNVGKFMAPVGTTAISYGDFANYAEGNTTDTTVGRIAGRVHYDLGEGTYIDTRQLYSVHSYYGADLVIGTQQAGDTLRVGHRGIWADRAIMEKFAYASGTSGTVTIDASVGAVYGLTPTGNVTTLSITNAPATNGRVTTITFVVEGTATAYTIAAPAGAIWFGSQPTRVANKRTMYTYMTADGGTTWLCSGVNQA